MLLNLYERMKLIKGGASMAKTGYTVKGLLAGEVDVQRLSEAELRKATRTLMDAANKQIKRLHDAGLTEESPAYRGLQTSTGKSDPKFTTSRDMSRNELMSSYVAVKQFLGGTTSGTAGTKKFLKQMESKISGYSELSSAQKKTLWSAYEKLKDTKGIIAIGSDVVQSSIIERVNAGQDADGIYKDMLGELDDL